MIAYIIFKNNLALTVVLNDEKLAKKEMNRLAKEDYSKNFKKLYNTDYSCYRSVVYWHVEMVNVLNSDTKPDEKTAKSVILENESKLCHIQVNSKNKRFDGYINRVYGYINRVYKNGVYLRYNFRDPVTNDDLYLQFFEIEWLVLNGNVIFGQ